MNIYQIIGVYWLVNTVIISVVFTDENDNSKTISSIAKIINKHIIVFYICETISLAISLWLIQIEVE